MKWVGKRRGVPIIHTQNLDFGVVRLGKRVRKSTESVRGALVVVSRVGRPSEKHICFYDGGIPVVLSDCVIALRSSCDVTTKALYERVWANRRLLLQSYIGSCAKYITITRLVGFLGAIGVQVTNWEAIERIQDRSSVA
jgi:hypothetical protein